MEINIKEQVARVKNEVIEICYKAGQAILNIYNDTAEETIILKEDSSPLTKADLASHEIIISQLANLTPTIPILSEESSNKSDISSSCYWLVDPLDGTKEFIKKNGEFTVNIALIEGGKPILGFVYAPVLDKLYYGDVINSKAFMAQGKKQFPIKVAAKTGKVLRVVGSRSHQSKNELELFLSGKLYEIMPCGSSLKFCLIAEGKADLYPRLGPTMIWDTAAGHAVVNAAGGSVRDLDGRELSYQVSNLRNSYFIAR